METSSRCLNCGAALAPGARYCPECGRSTTPRSANPWPWIVGGLLGLALVILLILILRPPQSPPVTEDAPGVPQGPPVVSAPASPPSGPPIASAPTRPPSGPPVTQTPPPVPEDPNRAAVRAYLERMAGIEKRRKEAVNNLYPAMMTMALLKSLGGMQDMLKMLDEDVMAEQKQQPQPDSVQRAEDTMQQYRSQLRALALEAQRISPPPPAQRFHRAYVTSLGSYDAVIGEIQTAMLEGDQSIAARGGELQSRVGGMLSAADAELGRLLAQYRLQRTFSVSDSAAGGLTIGP